MFLKAKQFFVQLLGKGQAGELARGSALLLVAKVFGAVSGYVMAFVLTQRGDAAAVGIYELAFTCIILLSVVARFGLDGAIVRYVGVFMANSEIGAVRWLYKKAMIFSALFALALGGLVFLLAPYLSALFGFFVKNKLGHWLYRSLLKGSKLIFSEFDYHHFYQNYHQQH